MVLENFGELGFWIVDSFSTKGIGLNVYANWVLKMRVTVRIKVNVTYLRFSCLLPKNPIPRDKCWVKGKTAFLRKLRILGWRWTHVPKSNFQLPRFCWETSLVAQSVKRLPITRETQVWSLGWEDPLEKEMATHSSTLAWKIPWTEECGGLQSMGSQRVRQWLCD